MFRNTASDGDGARKGRMAGRRCLVCLARCKNVSMTIITVKCELVVAPRCPVSVKTATYDRRKRGLQQKRTSGTVPKTRSEVHFQNAGVSTTWTLATLVIVSTHGSSGGGWTCFRAPPLEQFRGSMTSTGLSVPFRAIFGLVQTAGPVRACPQWIPPGVWTKQTLTRNSPTNIWR